MLIGNSRPARSMTTHRHNLLSPHFLEDQGPLPGTLYRRGAVSGTRDGRPVRVGRGLSLRGSQFHIKKQKCQLIIIIQSLKSLAGISQVQWIKRLVRNR